jgi:hypothetical protein
MMRKICEFLKCIPFGELEDGRLLVKGYSCGKPGKGLCFYITPRDDGTGIVNHEEMGDCPRVYE